MIARMWRGWVRTEKAAEYVEIVERTGMAGYRRTPGNEGAQLLTRDLGDGRTEIITLTLWLPAATRTRWSVAGDNERRWVVDEARKCSCLVRLP